MKVYFRLLTYVKKYRINIVWAFILSVLFSIFSALSVYLTIPLLKALFTGKPGSQIQSQQTEVLNGFIDKIQRFFDGFIYSGTMTEALLKICIMIFIAFFLKNLTSFLQCTTMQYIENCVLRDIRNEIYEKLNTFSVRFFSATKTGDVISRMTNDLYKMQLGVSAVFYNLLREPILIIILVLLAISISWKMTLMALVIFPVTVFFILKIGNTLRRRNQRVLEKISEIVNAITETIYGAKIIRAFSAEKFKILSFKKLSNEHLRLHMKNAVASELVSPITEILSIFSAIIIIWYGGNQIYGGGGLKPEEFFGFMFIIFQLLVPIKNLATVNRALQESIVSGKRVFELIDYPVEVNDKENPVELKSFEKSIEIKNVSFSYDENKTILKNINFDIKKSEIIALVGPSGAGKSTLVDLIPRFYDVTGGEILIDGFNIKDIKLTSLRNLIGIVPQEIILFNDTIRNNIIFGLENIEEEKLIEITKYANAYDFILDTEKGFDTIIGERGLKLSGGQKQRIAIARALLRNPQILILDEATSSLDMESEMLVQEALENLMINRTSIVIAHRLSTIKNADKIIVIDENTSQQIGTHEELMKTEGVYKRLYEIQYLQ
jgi:ATP-binding cassette, subfamily B, bacterial MsbA